ncbi:MAG: glutathione S-transferase family protein [Albidovulum sp.]|nr:glutathione S-transferase family protein [Albidovulum sp.]
MQHSVTLYHYPLSPFCRKLRMVLAEKKIEIETIEEQFWKNRPEFLMINPSGKVPLLKMNGKLFSDSQAICEYLEAIFPDPPLLPEDPEQLYEVRRLVFWFDGKFNSEVTSRLLDERMFKLIQKRGVPDSANLRFALGKLPDHIDYLHRLLNERRWLAGDQITLADFAASAHLSCVDYLDDIDWSRSDLVKPWYSALKSRPAFRSLLLDYIPGFQPKPIYTDLDF